MYYVITRFECFDCPSFWHILATWTEEGNGQVNRGKITMFPQTNKVLQVFHTFRWNSCSVHRKRLNSIAVKILIIFF